MKRAIAALLVLFLSLLAATHVSAQAFAFPAGFRTTDIATNGTTLHVRVGGAGPAVLLVHGYGDTGDMWVPLAATLIRDHTVIVPDLRGMGLSAVATDGFTKQNQAKDLAGVLDQLNVRRVDEIGRAHV